MISQRWFSRIPLFIAGAAAGATSSAGCFRDRILVGENWFDAAVGSPTGTGGAGAPGTGGRRALPTSDAGVGGNGADGGTSPADAGSMTVVSLGDKDSQGWPIAIAPEEVARRLSQFLLRKPPSAALTAAVAAAAPKTNQDVGQLTDGLLLQEASLAGRQAFYRWWLDLDALATAPRDPMLFPGFTADIRQALVDQAMMFAEDITWRPQGDLSTLLTEPAAFATTATAPWFPGVVVPAGSTPTRVLLDPTLFAGIVTQPAVVAVADMATRASPSRRGEQVLERYSCQLLFPPAALDPSAPAPQETQRQWLEAHTSACGGVCHSLIDPPGFAFGHMNALGQFQETENGLPVDTTGVLRAYPDSSSHPDLPFDGAPGLASHLAQLPEVRTCFATHWLGFATGRFATVHDAVAGYRMMAALSAEADYVVKRATMATRSVG
jgi:hypothetical protein